MEVQRAAVGRPRPRHGQMCAGGEYDLLACLADAAAAAPLGSPAMQAATGAQRQLLNCGSTPQTGPSSDSYLHLRRNALSRRVSTSPQAMDVTGSQSKKQHSEREVQVTCNGTLGTFLLPSQTVQCHCTKCAPEGVTTADSYHGNTPGGPQQAPAITPTEFERHSGLLTAKKWRNSIRLVHGDGTITIGKWLEQHNILPRPKCSGPLGSSSPGGSAAMTAVYGNSSFGADCGGHSGGLFVGSDVHTTGGTVPYGYGPRNGGVGVGSLLAHVPPGRCTLPPSRYPASEYVTGEDDEYDEFGVQQRGRAAGTAAPDDDGLLAHKDFDGAIDDEDYDDGLYGDAAEGAGSHATRGGRRAAVHRTTGGGNGARTIAAAQRSWDRRGSARAARRPGGSSASGASRAVALSKGHRGRQTAAQRSQQQQQQLQQQLQQQQQQLLHLLGRAAAAGMLGSSPGPEIARRGSGSGSGAVIVPQRDSSCQEDGLEDENDGGGGGDVGGGGGGSGKEHSSSEGSPPSDDSKRRDGSGGSGEGDGSGTGDGGDSRHPLAAAGGEGERGPAGEGPGCGRRSIRHGPGTAKPHPHLQQQCPGGGRESSADAVATQERFMRHAAAVKRLAPDCLTGPELGPLIKRTRTRPSGTTSVAGPGASSGEGGDGGWEPGADDVSALYQRTGGPPQVCGWRFLGASADPAADQVIMSVTINGRTYTGLLAPQQSGGPAPSPLTATAAAVVSNSGMRPPQLTHSVTNATGTLPSLPASRKAGSVRTNLLLPPLAPSSRLGLPVLGGTHEDAVMTLPAGVVGAESMDNAGPASTAAISCDDPALDDGMLPECLRCSLCHRCAVPVLAPPTSQPVISTAATVVAATSPASALVKSPLLQFPAASAAAGVAITDAVPVNAGMVDMAITTTTTTTMVVEEDNIASSAAAAVRSAKSSFAQKASREQLAAVTVATAASDVKIQSSSALKAELLPSPAAAMDVAREGALANLAVTAAAMGPSTVSTPCSQPQPQPEASRTCRQTGWGLGPLVEVRVGGAGDGAGGGSGLSSAAATATVAVVHSQCALWSPEVFVISGSMYGVSAVVKRSRGQRCAHCGRSGASLSCCSGKCGRVYHLPCAMEAGAGLVAEPYSVACPLHRTSPTAAAATATAGSHPGVLPVVAQGRCLTQLARPRPVSPPSLDGSQSFTNTIAAATMTVGAPTPTPALSSQQLPQQVPLPLSLQLAAGRRSMPALPTVSSAGGASPAAAIRDSRHTADATSLPALMMLRSQADGLQAAPGNSSSQLAVLRSSPMTPPPATVADATTAVTANQPISGEGDVPEDGTAVAEAAAAAAWAYSNPQVFERRQAALEVTVASSGASMLPHVHGSAAAPAEGMDGDRNEASCVSDGSELPSGAVAAVVAAAPVLKRRREVVDGCGDCDPQPKAKAMTPFSDAKPPLLWVGTPAAVSGEGAPPPSPSRLLPPQQRPLPPPLPLPILPFGIVPPMFLGVPPMFLGRSGASSEPGSCSTGDTLGLGLGLGLDPTSGLHLSHASALKLLQQHPQLSGALPEGVAAMLLAAHHHHQQQLHNQQLQQQQHSHHLVHSGNSFGLRPAGGEGSVGSPGSTATDQLLMLQQQTVWGMPSDSGRQRHHHQQHNHHHSQHHGQGQKPPSQQMQLNYCSAFQPVSGVAAAQGMSCSAASGSAATGFGRGGGRGCGGEESVSALPNCQMPPPGTAHCPGVSGAVAGVGGAACGAALTHMLPRAARNIEGLLPSRPLLHNPYVPSSGDPSADLMLSKIAQNGSWEVEAELLGGTTGRAGHSGRCAVCVIQRKGKCGTESAPKKCLRRQLVALQKATAASVNVSQTTLSTLGGGLDGGGGAVSASVSIGGGSSSAIAVEDSEDVHLGDATEDAVVPYLSDRIAAAAAEQRARERARRETWSLPLGQGSGATGKRTPGPPAAAAPPQSHQQPLSPPIAAGKPFAVDV